jgi:hypothetical protein
MLSNWKTPVVRTHLQHSNLTLLPRKAVDELPATQIHLARSMGGRSFLSIGMSMFLKFQTENAFTPLRVRVPLVYLPWANSLFLAFFAFNGINNLRAFNVAFSSIPTAPTNFLLVRLPG